MQVESQGAADDDNMQVENQGAAVVEMLGGEPGVAQHVAAHRVEDAGYSLKNVHVNLCTSYRTHFNSTMNQFMAGAMVGGEATYAKEPRG